MLHLGKPDITSTVSVQKSSMRKRKAHEGGDSDGHPVEYPIGDAAVTELEQERAFAADSDAHPATPKRRRRKCKVFKIPDSDTHPARTTLDGLPVEYSIADAAVTELQQAPASAVDSDAHPATPKRRRRKRKARETSDSDTHPARTTLDEGQQLARTPLWDNVVDKLDMAASTLEGYQFMQFLEEQCFKSASGGTLKNPMPFGIKMERLLETAAKRRKLKLEHLRRSAAQPVPDLTHEIEEMDMQIMYNEWLWDMDAWMNEENRKTFHDLGWKKRKPVEAQQMAVEAFDVYKSELAGSKFLLHKLIQLPIIAQCSAAPSDSAELPASLMKCINDWQEHKKTDEYKAAVERSQRRAEDLSYLSKRIWHANWLLAKGKEASMLAQQGQFRNLEKWQKKLVKEYDSGRLEISLKKLLDKQTPIYRTIGA